MPQIDKNSLVTKTDTHLESEVDGEIVLMGIDDGQFFSLSGTGKAIWQALETDSRVSDLIAGLMTRYDVDEATCQAETLALLEELQARHLVEIKTPE